jgi:adenosylcobyric acid synthase
MTALMVQGVSSSAGKSLLVTGLARWFARRGVDVAPFKAQNMSNNARVVAGGEIGVAQWLQALAAGVTPDVRMNPVLVKPEADTRSQVVVLGKPDRQLSGLAWRDRAPLLWPVAQRALRELLAQHELVLLEGAGSPAEINLRSTDLANMRSAAAADAAVVLVADIDRGGAFAHLFGTWRLLERTERDRVRGFVLNKFRGDPALLDPAPRVLEERTRVRTLGVVPWLAHGLPDEDGASTPARHAERPRVAVVRYPTASNLDEFRLLDQVADVVWADTPGALDDAELVVLPGSKNVAGDRRWLRERSFDDALRSRAAHGKRILGICGGLQLLGRRFDDAGGVDGSGDGVGLVPLRTTFAADKRARSTTTRFAILPEPWAELSGVELNTYEIRHGSSEPERPVAEALPNRLGWVAGAVLAVYVHGLFEEPGVLQALFGAAARRSLDDTFEQLADTLERHLDMPAIAALAGVD